MALLRAAARATDAAKARRGERARRGAPLVIIEVRVLESVGTPVYGDAATLTDRVARMGLVQALEHVRADPNGRWPGAAGPGTPIAVMVADATRAARDGGLAGALAAYLDGAQAPLYVLAHPSGAADLAKAGAIQPAGLVAPLAVAAFFSSVPFVDAMPHAAECGLTPGGGCTLLFLNVASGRAGVPAPASNRLYFQHTARWGALHIWKNGIQFWSTSSSLIQEGRAAARQDEGGVRSVYRDLADAGHPPGIVHSKNAGAPLRTCLGAALLYVCAEGRDGDGRPPAVRRHGIQGVRPLRVVGGGHASLFDSCLASSATYLRGDNGPAMRVSMSRLIRRAAQEHAVWRRLVPMAFEAHNLGPLVPFAPDDDAERQSRARMLKVGNLLVLDVACHRQAGTPYVMARISSINHGAQGRWAGEVYLAAGQMRVAFVTGEIEGAFRLDCVAGAVVLSRLIFGQDSHGHVVGVPGGGEFPVRSYLGAYGRPHVAGGHVRGVLDQPRAEGVPFVGPNRLDQRAEELVHHLPARVEEEEEAGGVEGGVVEGEEEAGGVEGGVEGGERGGEGAVADVGHGIAPVGAVEWEAVNAILDVVQVPHLVVQGDVHMLEG